MSRINRGITSPTQFRTPDPQNPQYVQIQPEVTQFRQLEQVLTGFQRAASAYGSYTYNKKRGEERAESAARQQKADDEREAYRVDQAIEAEVTRSAKSWITQNPNHSPEEFLTHASEQRKKSLSIVGANQWLNIEAGAVPAVVAEKKRQTEKSVDIAVNRIRSSGDSAQQQAEDIRALATNNWNQEEADLYLAYLPTALQKEVIEERQIKNDAREATGKEMQAALATIALGLEGGTAEERARAKSDYLVDRFLTGTDDERALASGMIAPGLDDVSSAEEAKANAVVQSELADLANREKDPNELFDHFKQRYKDATGVDRIAVGRILVGLSGANRGQDSQNEADVKREELVQVDLDVAEINTLKDPNERLQRFIDLLDRERSPEAKIAILRQFPKENALVEGEQENAWKIRMLRADTLEEMQHLTDLYREVYPVSNLAVQMESMVQDQEKLNDKERENLEIIKTLIKAHDEMREMSPAQRITYLEEMAAGLITTGREKEALYFKEQIAQYEKDVQTEEELRGATKYIDEFVKIEQLVTPGERLDAMTVLFDSMSDSEKVSYGTRLIAAQRAVTDETRDTNEAVEAVAIAKMKSVYLPLSFDQVNDDLRSELDSIFGDNVGDKNKRAGDRLMSFLENQDDLTQEDVKALSATAYQRVEAWRKASDTKVADDQKLLAKRVMDNAPQRTIDGLNDPNLTFGQVMAEAQATYTVWSNDWQEPGIYWSKVLGGVNVYYDNQDLSGRREIIAELSKLSSQNVRIHDTVNSLAGKYVTQVAQEDLLGLSDMLRNESYTTEGLERLRLFIQDPSVQQTHINKAVDNFQQKISSEEFRGIKSLSVSSFKEKFASELDSKLAPLRKFVKERDDWQLLNNAHKVGDTLNAADLKTLWDGDLYSKMLTQALDNGDPDALRALLNGNGAEQAGIGAKYLNTRSNVPGPLVDKVKSLASSSDPEKLHQAALILASSRMHPDFLKDSSGSLDALVYAARIVYPPGSQGRTSSDPNAVDPIVSEMEKYKEAMNQKPSGPGKGWPDFKDYSFANDALDVFNSATGNSITNQDSLRRIQQDDTFRVMFSQTSGDDEGVRATIALDRMRKAGFIPVLNYAGNLGGKDSTTDKGVYTFIYDPNSRTRVIPELKGLTHHEEEGNVLMDIIREAGATFELDNQGSSNIPWMELEEGDIEVRWKPQNFINAESDEYYPLTVTYSDQEFTYSIPKKSVDDLLAERDRRDNTQSVEDPGWFEFSNLQYDSLYDLFSHSVGADSVFPWGRNRILTPW
jgi:hypothetical protein